jgi:uncharacterized membrane protein
MTWLQRYHVRHYLANSIWLLPVLSMAAAMGVVPLLHGFETRMGWQSPVDPDTARAVLGTMAASMFTFIVFVSSALLVAVQLASSQLTPRIIAIVFKDPVTRLSLTVFVFTFTFALAALVRITTTVPLLTAHVAAYSCLASLAVFLYLIDHVGKALRPSGALRGVARLGHAVIEDVYPRSLAESANTGPAPAAALDREPTHTILNCNDGVVLAFDIPGLVALATRTNCVIEMVPQVGDFVAVGAPLFRVYQGGASVPEEALCQSVAVGQERTLEQDPTFAFRIIVDIASKGLSPAINDPTTAVLALDQLHYLLRDVGRRDLNDERVRDAAGTVRLVYRTPGWDDFVRLSITEIRQFGSASIQVARRLRALLENLIGTLAEERAALLRQELKVLNRSTERFFTDPEDRALAGISDFQGVGGKHGRGRPDQPVKERTNPPPSPSEPAGTIELQEGRLP